MVPVVAADPSFFRRRMGGFRGGGGKFYDTAVSIANRAVLHFKPGMTSQSGNGYSTITDFEGKCLYPSLKNECGELRSRCSLEKEKI